MIWEDWEDAIEAGEISARWLESTARTLHQERAACHTPAQYLGVSPMRGADPEWRTAWQERRDSVLDAVAAVRACVVEQLKEYASPDAAASFYEAAQNWRLAVAGLAACMEAIEVFLQVLDGSTNMPIQQAAERLTPLRWVEVVKERPLTTKPSWELLVQWRAEAHAVATHTTLYRDQLYRAVPWSQHGVAPVWKDGQEGRPLDLEDWIWSEVLRLKAMQHPELMAACRKKPAIVSTAAEVLMRLHGDGIGRRSVSLDYIAFRGRVLALVSADKSRPALRILPDGHPELRGIAGRTAHDMPLDEADLEAPLPPEFRFEGDLLTWLAGERTPMRRMTLDEVPPADGPDGHAGSRASVLWSILSQQGFSAQTAWIFCTFLGRCLYANTRFDQWSMWMHVQGPTRCGKGVLVLQFLMQVLGMMSVGQMNVGQRDLFATAGLENWAALIIQELGSSSGRHDGVDPGWILSLVSGEPTQIREMRKSPRAISGTGCNLITTGNGPQPFPEKAGEFSSRVVPVKFTHSAREDMNTELNAIRARELVATIALCVRCYAATREAVGHRSLRQFLPRDLVDDAAMSAVEGSLLTQFFRDQQWCALTPPAMIKRSLTARAGTIPAHQQCEWATLSRLRDAFRAWVRKVAPSSRMVWTPSEYVPVFAALGFAWFDKSDLEAHPLNEHVSSEETVYGVGLTGYAMRQLDIQDQLSRSVREFNDLAGKQRAETRDA